MRLIVFYIISLAAISVPAQKQKNSAPLTVRGNIGIPRTITSDMFRTAFNGVYEVNLSVNARLAGNFFVGGGYQNTQLQNNKNVFAYYQFKDPNGNLTGASLSYNTRLMCHGGFIKLGYDKFFEKGYMSYSLNTGVMACSYQNVNLDTALANRPYPSTKFTAPYIEPEVSVNFLNDGSLGFSIMLSYTTMLYHFDPKAPRFNHIEEVNTQSNSYVMSWLNIGFGFTVLLGKR